MSILHHPTVITPDSENGPSFASNNPFRNRASQIPPLSPLSPTSFGDQDRLSTYSSNSQQSQRPPRPVSRNPFLDVFDDLDDVGNDIARPRTATNKSNSFSEPSGQKSQFTGATLDLFNALTVEDKSNNTQHLRQRSDNMEQRRPAPASRTGTGNLRPPQPPPPQARRLSRGSADDSPPLITIDSDAPSRPRDRERERERDRGGERERRPTNGASRDGREGRRPEGSRRPRRNSDSSVIDAHEADKEKERRDRRRREEARRRDGKDDKSRSSKTEKEKERERRKKGTPLDVIDKLDVTGIYGSGLFHHDGPFDACNPHRNKNTRKAPMQAFPEGSANNALTGFGPTSTRGDYTNFAGTGNPEAFSEFSMPAARRGSAPADEKRPSAPRAQSFDPVARIEPVHGDETLGLGTSTFLDGAPASRKAIEEQKALDLQNEILADKQKGGFGGGIQRKKSLAQKIRSISGNRPNYNNGNLPSPNEERQSPRFRKDSTQSSNPFFSEYDNSKSEVINVVNREEGQKNRDRAPSSPSRIRIKDDRPEKTDGGGSGFIKRVRSLSKPKRRD